MMTCYSSYLDLDLSKVPPIHELFDTVIPKEFWWTTLLNWLESIGCELRNSDKDPYLDHKDWNFPGPWPDYYFVSGTSPRDKYVHHVVIFKKGKLYWDPHPDRTGILTKTRYETITVKDSKKFNLYTKKKR